MGLGVGGVRHGRPVAVDGRDLSLYEEFAFGRGSALDEFDVVVSRLGTWDGTPPEY